MDTGGFSTTEKLIVGAVSGIVGIVLITAAVFLFLSHRRIGYLKSRPRGRSPGPAAWLKSQAERSTAAGYMESHILPMARRPSPSRREGEGSDGRWGLARHAAHHGAPVDVDAQIRGARARQHGLERQVQHRERQQQQLDAAYRMFHRASRQLSQHVAAQEGPGAESPPPPSPSPGLRWGPALRGLRRVFGGERAGGGAAEDPALSTVDERTEPASSVLSTPVVASVGDRDAGRGRRFAPAVGDRRPLLGVPGTVAEEGDETATSVSMSLSGYSSAGEAAVSTAVVARMTSAMSAICVNLDNHNKNNRAGSRAWDHLQAPPDARKGDNIPSRPKAAYSAGAGRNARYRPSAQSSQMAPGDCASLPPRPAPPSPPSSPEPVLRLRYRYPQFAGVLDPSRARSSRLFVQNGIEDSDRD